jgi:hypothetical protein
MVAIERLMPNHDRFSPRHFVGLVIGFGGIVVLVWPEIRLGQAPGFLGGVLATQMGCAGWALGSAYARRRHKDESVLAGVAIQMVGAGLCGVFRVRLRAEAPAHRDGLTLRLHRSRDCRPAGDDRTPRAVQPTHCRRVRCRARGHGDRQEHWKNDGRRGPR